MPIAFLDETYTKTEYYIAAVIVEENDLTPLTLGLGEIVNDAIERHGVLDGAELHGHEIMQYKKAWAPMRGKHKVAAGIYREALRVVAERAATILIRGVHIERLNHRYKYPHHPHRVALQHVLEDVNAYGVRTGKNIVVIADEVPDQDHHTQQVEIYSISGTPGYKPSKLPNILQPIRFARSCDTAGLQAADLVAYIYQRTYCHPAASPKAEQAARLLWDAVKPRVAKHWRWDP